jgi:hypothetical protein
VPVELKKMDTIDLRAAGLGEKWLQDQIRDDPRILGLGELEIVGREHRQPVGGRIDFLMRDAEDTYYEVEVMLGSLDETHIIRTIEYWDVERQRRPTFDHRAVIVAEKITSRFFNVLRLLNRTVPMIAVQLSAFRIDENKIGLHPATVLDVVEEIADAEVFDQAEQTDRAYWEKKAEPTSLAVMDKLVSLLRNDNMNPRLTYNRYHIAVGTTGYNFCWITPRKSQYCHVDIRVSGEERDLTLSSMQKSGIDASPRRTKNITFGITSNELDEHSAIILDAFKRAEQFSQR